MKKRRLAGADLANDDHVVVLPQREVDVLDDWLLVFLDEYFSSDRVSFLVLFDAEAPREG